MTQANAQIRLRRAFRYGYFAFLALFLVLLTLVGVSVADGALDDILSRLSSATTVMLAALALGLCVPLFFACWSLIGSAILGLRAGPQSLLDGIRD